jgi:non-homologous end joining protein Ku
VLAGKEKLAAVRPKGNALALETLFVAEDVKSQRRSTRRSRRRR